MGQNSVKLWNNIQFYQLKDRFNILANLIRWRDKPVALSIVQARLVGLVHFAVGFILTFAAFLIASTSGKFG